MLHVEMGFDDIILSNVKKEDLSYIQQWMITEEEFLNDESNLENLTERFLESYISECEFFVKIISKGNIIGILKGRVEFKNPNEAWIWFFYINNKHRTNDLDNRIIKELINYFYEEYGIDLFFTRVIKNDNGNLKFWKSNGFRVMRVVKDFYCFNNKRSDMLIMKKMYS